MPFTPGVLWADTVYILLPPVRLSRNVASNPFQGFTVFLLRRFFPTLVQKSSMEKKWLELFGVPKVDVLGLSCFMLRILEVHT